MNSCSSLHIKLYNDNNAKSSSDDLSMHTNLHKHCNDNNR